MAERLSVLAHVRTQRRHHRPRYHDGAAKCLSARRHRHRGSAPASPPRRDIDDAPRSHAVRGRPGAPAPQRVDDAHLRPGGSGRTRSGRSPVARSRAMSALRRQFEEYLALRRALGYTLCQEGRMLASFIDYLESQGATRVTVEVALVWAMAPRDASPTWWAKRLVVVRGFARYLQTMEPETEVPPTNLLATRASRTTPYLYSPGEIAALMEAATHLVTPLRAA